MADKEKKVKDGENDVQEKESKEQIKGENKILKIILILIGVIVVLGLGGYLFIDNVRHFDYLGVDYEVVKFCDTEPCLILYQTSLPVVHNGVRTDYNFYLRNDPRELETVEFDGDITLLPEMIINSTGDFNCDGDGVIAIANLVQLYEVVGTKVMRNESIQCDLLGGHTFIQIQEGDETRINKFGVSCYEINVNNCEILEGTEKFMIKSFAEVQKLLN